MSAEQLQNAINDAITQKNVWSAELMRLNAELSKAKIGQRSSLRKSIKNTEQQIEDYNRNIKKLNDDLAKLLKASVKNEDNVILANQGISPGAAIANTLGQTAQSLIPSLTGALDSGKRAADATSQTITETKSFFKDNMMYIVIAVVALIFIMKKK